MAPTSIIRRTLFSFPALLGLTLHAAVYVAAPLAAQETAAAGRGVVIQASVTEETIPPELTREQGAAALGAMSATLEAVCSLMDIAGGAMPMEVAAEFEGPLLSLGDACRGDVVPPPTTPEPVHSDYTIYIRDDLMTVEAAGYPKMVWQAAEGRQSKMWFEDPETGRIVPFGLPGGITPLRSVEESTPAADADVDASTSPTGRTDELLGYPVREYHTERAIRPGFAAQLTAMMADVSIQSRGSAWIAPETPYNEVVATFFANFATGTESQSGGVLTGLTSSMADGARLGVPLKSVDTTSVVLSAIIDSDVPSTVELEKTVDTTVITDIRWEDIPDEKFWGDNPPPDGTDPRAPAATPSPSPGDEPCDCSCEAMRELEDLDDDDPGALAKAMCAQECVTQWMHCGG